MHDLKEKLIGAWRLVGWGVTDGDKVDPNLPPLGLVENSGGLLIYTESGMMSAVLSLKSRPAFSDPSLDGGTVQERADAFASIVSYSGKFSTVDDTSEVFHEVEYATLPHFVGQKMRRICIFNGIRLKLDTPSMVIGGKSQSSYIEWERI